MSGTAALDAHLGTGSTTVCRCWALTRRDGVRLGFTDHDRDLAFDGMIFRAATGLTGRAVESRSGLSVDNSEILGVLSDTAITEADVDAGRWDGAAVAMWSVNWADVAARRLEFRGKLGEIERSSVGFRAELRGLAQALNQVQGFVYQGMCSAVLGDTRCRVDLSAPGLVLEAGIIESVNARTVRVVPSGDFAARWFERGRLRFLSGAAEGLTGVVKADRATEAGREFELWEEVRAEVRAGDLLRVEAGCDRSAETCRRKFMNFKNFRGFPHVPGEDWQMAYPSREVRNDGGSRNR